MPRCDSSTVVPGESSPPRLNHYIDGRFGPAIATNVATAAECAELSIAIDLWVANVISDAARMRTQVSARMQALSGPALLAEVA